jgi:hypothetical protein
MSIGIIGAGILRVVQLTAEGKRLAASCFGRHAKGP